MKNKLLVCLLAFTMILSLSACGDKQPAVSLAGGSSSSAAESSSEPSGSISEPASGSEGMTVLMSSQLVLTWNLPRPAETITTPELLQEVWLA